MPGTPTPYGKNDSNVELCIKSIESSKEGSGNKQDQLLQVCVQLLFNIAENTKVEEKMRKRNISHMLIKILEKNSEDLLITCVKFLKKLSIFKENKDDMADSNITDKFNKLFSIGNKELTLLTLKLMYNLSFDTKIRDRIILSGHLSKLVSCLREFSYNNCIKRN